jgi:hypothetical protein
VVIVLIGDLGGKVVPDDGPQPLNIWNGRQVPFDNLVDAKRLAAALHLPV